MSVLMPADDVERIDLNPDGTVDDVAISHDGMMFRLEQMGPKSYWCCVYMPDGTRREVFWFYSKKKIDVQHRTEEL